MSKRNSDGDVLSNRINVGLAKQQRLLASLLGPKPDADLNNERARAEQDREQMEDEIVVPEKIGIGGKVPKDIQDGSFTRRAMTSNDKLLEQLIGKKAAKAHLAAKSAPKSPSTAQRSANPSRTAKREVSEDEEEGRTSAFRSKRPKKKLDSAPGTLNAKDEEDNSSETNLTLRIANVEDDSEEASEKKAEADPEESGGDVVEAPHNPRLSKSRPGSYLDEILAERSKKKKKKRNKANVASGL